jgi:hypothetical protein
MRTVEFDLISTLLVTMAVLFLGRTLVARVPVLGRLTSRRRSSAAVWWRCSWPWSTACCT